MYNKGSNFIKGPSEVLVQDIVMSGILWMGESLLGKWREEGIVLERENSARSKETGSIL